VDEAAGSWTRAAANGLEAVTWCGLSQMRLGGLLEMRITIICGRDGCVCDLQAG